MICIQHFTLFFWSNTTNERKAKKIIIKFKEKRSYKEIVIELALNIFLILF